MSQKFKLLGNHEFHHFNHYSKLFWFHDKLLLVLKKLKLLKSDKINYITIILRDILRRKSFSGVLNLEFLWFCLFLMHPPSLSFFAVVCIQEPGFQTRQVSVKLDFTIKNLVPIFMITTIILKNFFVQFFHHASSNKFQGSFVREDKSYIQGYNWEQLEELNRECCWD